MNIEGQKGEVTIQLQIKRKDTGLIEHVTLIGHVTGTEKKHHDNDSIDSSAQRGN